MRIALVYDGVYPYSVGGGEKLFHDLARYLGQRHDVSVLGLKMWDGPEVIEVAPRVRIHGICVPDAAGTLQAGDARGVRQALRFARSACSALRQLGPFDVVDCMSIPYFPLYAAHLQCRASGAALVSTWLECWGRDHWREYLGSEIKARVASAVERYAMRLPRHIVSISPQTSEALSRAGVDAARLTTITPWLDWPAIQSAQPGRESYDVLFVGRLIKSKGADLLIEAVAFAAAHRPGLRCRIVGDGPERPRLEALVVQLGLSETVTFSGFLDCHDDVIAVMKAARLLVLPSRREGFGIVVIEAAAAGAVPITIDTPNNAARNLVRESGCGAVCADSPEELAEAIQHFLDLPEGRYAAEQDRGRAWARQYDFPRAAEAYEAVYTRVAGEARG
ncbi:MAG: glycosyltransferase [Candidatus Hydrogenedentes bacterium]|nr:glycosyltransferase [Candidatus Hydrogenedentota bacterium]